MVSVFNATARWGWPNGFEHSPCPEGMGEKWWWRIGSNAMKTGLDSSRGGVSHARKALRLNSMRRACKDGREDRFQLPKA
jgi:hypothetical protein